MASLFEKAAEDLARQHAPLADRVRPGTLAEWAGEGELLRAGSPLRQAIESDTLPSMILWGPPGSGKTTLAHIIARHTKAQFVAFSAVTSGVKEAREIIAAARARREKDGHRTVLFVDEIHRFNKAQQDAFLPSVEKGIVTLVGATTENPSFEVNAALLSRCRVFVLPPLGKDALLQILRGALQHPAGLPGIEVLDAALEVLAESGAGDARTALGNLEWVAACLPADTRRVTLEHVRQALPQKMLLYDKTGEEHYSTISALHKSIRGSDPQAAVYWLARMLEAGEDPLYLARRLVRIAVEDVGLADPQALAIAVAAKDAYHFLGTPEGELALAEVAIYLACAPKSNRADQAYQAARAAVQRHGALPVPLPLRNAVTPAMKALGYGKGYLYAHDFENAYAAQDYLPEALRGEEYYRPGKFGFEKEIRRRLEWWRKLREEGGQADAEGSDPERRSRS